MRLLSFFLVPVCLLAQPGVPSAVFHGLEKMAEAAPGQREGLRAAPERWLGPVSEGERAVRVREGLTQVSVHRGVGRGDVEGEWQRARGGTAVWRMVLRSPGAVALRLHLQDFHADGKLWITELSGDERQSFGPFTGDGIYGDGDFWTNAALGEAVLIEYETSSRSRVLPFRIGEISHFTELPVRFAKAGDGRAASLGCNIDVSCRPEYAELARAVARISFETSEGGALCSGTVLNTRSGSMIPYFMTAAHCISTDAEARTVEAFFQYQRQSCNGAAPGAATVKRTLGARYVAGSSLEGGDYTLLRLNSVPDGTVFAGWEAGEMPVGTAVTGIHHPRGDYKKISFGARTESQGSRSRPAANFYTINWREGVTEGGSSGSGIFNDQGKLVGMLSGGPRPPAGKTECDLRPAYDWYGRFDVAFAQIQTLLEDRAGTAPGGTGPANPGAGTLLTNGTPARVTLAAAANSTFYSGTQGYRVVVPEGATELELTLAVAGGDVDLFVSQGSEPALEGGRVRAEYSATGDTGNERIVINAQSSPGLRAGTYFIALASYATGRELSGTLTARIRAASQAVVLTSGVTRTFSLAPVTGTGGVFTGANAYRIEVPAGAAQLQIRVTTATANADVDLFARFGTEVVVENGRTVADYRSVSETGNELITINAQSTPPLRAGTYYIALGLFTAGIAVNGSLTATVTTATAGGGTQPVVLTSGTARVFNFPATAELELNTGGKAFQITVPEGAARLRVDLRTATADADVDLFVSYGTQARVGADGNVVADFASEGFDGNESIVISKTTSPALRAGVYYIHFVNYANQKAITGTITATVERTPAVPAAPTVLTSGVPGRLELPAVDDAILFAGNYGFRIEVPEGATRLTVRLATATPDADVDLYMRYGADVDLTSDGELIADFYSETATGNEVIVLTATSNPPLRAGTYYIATGLFTAGVNVTGSVTATVERAPAGTPALGRELTLGSTVSFTLNAVDGPTLFTAREGFRVNVTQPGGLKFELRTSTPGVDVDLHVRFQQPPGLANGRIASDFAATGDTGDEDLTVLPSLIGNRLGTYYVALAVYTAGVPVSGTLRVTQLAPGVSGDAKREDEGVRKEREGGKLKAKVRLIPE